MTLDTPSSTTVHALKTAIIESRQAEHMATDAGNLVLFLHAQELPDASTLERVGGAVSRLHLALSTRGQFSLVLSQTQPSGTSAPLDGLISCRLPDGLTAGPVPAALIELRGWLDQPCEGESSYDPETTTISFRATRALAPDRVHTVLLRAASIYAAWQFRTCTLSSVRLLLELVGQLRPRLVTLQRDGPSLLAELGSAAGHVFSGLACDFSTDGAPVDDLAIGRFEDGQLVQCTPRPSVDPTSAVIHSEVPALDPDEYARQHWVNPQAGFLAVVGKLTAEEEEEALLAIVQAFASADDAPGPSRAEAAAPAPTALTTEVPRGLIERRWGGPRAPRVFCATAASGESSTAAALLAELRSHGFAVLRLPDAALQTVERVYDAWAELCAGPQDAKQTAAERENYLGYHHRPHFCKELFQLRSCRRAAAAFPPHATSLRAAATAAFAALAALSGDLLVALLAQMRAPGGDPAETAAALLEAPFAERADCEAVSQSNLTLFRYSPALGAEPTAAVASDVHCPYHTDIGLLSIIPRGRGAPGLHLFDHFSGYEQRLEHCPAISSRAHTPSAGRSEGWVDIEAGMPEGHAVLMGGESFLCATNQQVLPGVHQVAHVAGERLSCPFQLLARADAGLSADRLGLDPAIVGPTPHEATQVTAQRFVESLSAQRISSNFPR